MSNYKHILRKCFLTAAVLCLFVTAAVTASAAKFGECYDADAAVSYAAAHWDDGVGVCDQFVKACLKAGGVEILAGDVDPVKDALTDTGLGISYSLKISADGVHALKSENSGIQAGDILFFYCEKCSESVHTVIVGGYDAKGYMYTYGHNPGWNKVSALGNFTHTGEDKTEHSECFQLFAVAMNREAYSHTHNFTSDLYESSHPHKMYAKCSCNAKYYLGWNARVSSCSVCNPPVSDVPIVTLESTGSAIVVNWTTVKDAVEYQVWRSTGNTEKFTRIYTSSGVKFTNGSVKAGNVYFYKVLAVLEKDSGGNAVKTVAGEIVACTLENGVVVIPEAPEIKVKLNSSKKAVVSWKSVSGAVKYEVWRSTSKNGTYTKLTTTTKLSYVNSAKAGTYYYKVRAVGAGAVNSSFSNVVCAKIPKS